MTKSDAVTKECPIFVVTLSFVVAAAEDPPAAAKKLHEYQFCHGDKCMMWRTIRAAVPSGTPGLATVKDGAGYCGLAGKL